MGNTVTKEGDVSSNSHNARRISTRNSLAEQEMMASKSNRTNSSSNHSSSNSRTQGNSSRNTTAQSYTHTTPNTASSTTSHTHHSSSHHHHHHHHSSNRHRSSRKRNPADYELIKDLNETVDGGLLFPQGVYTGPTEFKVTVVREVIIRRKLAPFYKGLDSVEPEWTPKELVEKVKPPAPESPPKPGQPGPATSSQLEWLYKTTYECPICFLVYPRLNSTRCCGQGICTECFVQIKRNPPHPPYTSNNNNEAADVLDLLSEPAACPYCAQPDLGVKYEAPPFEWGIPCPNPSEPLTTTTPQTGGNPFGGPFDVTAPKVGETEASKHKPLDLSNGVTVDMIHPDWEEKLASARRRLARKAHAARMLHQNALLPNNSNNDSGTSSQNRISDVQINSLAYSQLGMEYNERLTASQARALEQKLIDEAIRASLTQ